MTPSVPVNNWQLLISKSINSTDERFYVLFFMNQHDHEQRQWVLTQSNMPRHNIKTIKFFVFRQVKITFQISFYFLRLFNSYFKLIFFVVNNLLNSSIQITSHNNVLSAVSVSEYIKQNRNKRITLKKW